MYRWLKTIWHKRYRHKENCLYLVGDDDELDLIDALEKHFDIEIQNDPAIAEASDMGLLFDIIQSHVKLARSTMDEGTLWNELTCLISKRTGYDRPINRQTTFFYYT